MNCHSGGKALIEFKNYESIYGRRAMIKYVIENKLIPPWSLSEYTGPWKNNPSLNSKEKEIILKWIDEGLPYKNRNIKLFHHQKTETIKNPDHVIQLDKPVKIPATGFIPYKRLISFPSFSEDKYLKEVEYVIMPQVIHHILVSTLDKVWLPELKHYQSQNWHDKEQMIAGWAPGADNLKKQDQNIGIKIPKNSAFVVRIHYEPIGQKLIDTKSLIKFKFYSNPPKHVLFNDNTTDKKLNIPPFQNNYKSEVHYKLKKDILLKGMGTHMHLRGKSSSVLIQDLEGNETEIFNLNPYIFNFQRSFHFKKALRVPKGYTLICRNYFDNSAENPANPDPSKNVKKGFYTEDEMSECFFNFLIPNF